MKEFDTAKLLEVGIQLSTEKDADLLLEEILSAAMDFTNCDGGTLYTTNENSLDFRTMITKSLGIRKNGKDEPITLPPVPMSRKNVCTCAALDNAIINIPDVYFSESYDFSGPRNYDAITGYRTQSMLVIPMENNRDEVIGVLQLINAQNSEGGIIAFDSGYERLILSLSAQAAMRLTNINYQREVEDLLDSFVRVMSSAIDERSPYTANHSRNMARYSERFISWLDKTANPWQFSEMQKRQFLMSVQLHDIGKLVIPLEIMDKESRLGSAQDEIEHRLEVLTLQSKVDYLEGKITSEVHEKHLEQIAHGSELMNSSNKAGFLPDDKINEILSLALPTYENADGSLVPLLTADEAARLSVQKGTLTPEERGVMESHVVVTERLLGQMNFSKDYSSVKGWAASHHEHLNGKGYPKRLSGDEIPPEARLLTIVDVFDALTANDRPYKPAMPTEKALGILSSMVKDGQIDGDILALFIECSPWKDEETL
ncbi:MAG: GAF domain-containing protein [Oscillospiraceae bacterium]|jgi:HD-GYP domain-containing protein (c-di-GMP phosphodiesterase class II)|nr:GAF domain-containing protein [Oscillospiraceae bacterium]